MVIQSKNGKGFEYACLKVFKEYLENKDNTIEVLNTRSTHVAKDDYYGLSKELQFKMDKAGRSAVKVISILEPLLLHSKGDKLCLTLQADKKGITGDVRDLIAIRKEEEWEIGVSCKHNHSAVKHSRLSKQLDFGTKWFNIPCSDTYFKEISPIFDRLEELKSDGVKWSVIPHKSETIYIPILKSFY